MSKALKIVIYLIGIAIICFCLLNYSATPAFRLLLIILGLLVMFIPTIVNKVQTKKHSEIAQ